MVTPVEVPKLGNSVEECLISRWVKRKGDAVLAGDLVAEIETDKATFEVTAPVDGTILDTCFEEGALAPVFTTLFVVGPSGAVFQASPAVLPAATPALSPRARRFAREHNIAPPLAPGSGPNGRILEADLKLHAPQASPLPAPRASVRDRIARRMRESLATTAQYTLHASADAAALLALRTALPGININHLVTFCTIEALLDVPALNAEYVEGQIRPHSEVHLGFACDTPRGLLVPVVHHADSLALDELALQMKQLAGQAAAGTISPDDLTGATFTISNLGALGIEAFTPLLNPPQVAILGVGAIQLKPVRRDGGVAFIDAIGLSLTCDHQVIDGAPGARFLEVLRHKIETCHHS